MKNTLYFKKRGCDFNNDIEWSTKSDIGNYRIITNDPIKFKNGINYLIEITSWKKSIWRYNHKNNPNKRLKKPVFEKFVYTMGLTFQYENSQGCFLDLTLERKYYNLQLPYTKESILQTINENVENKFDEIKFYDIYDKLEG